MNKFILNVLSIFAFHELCFSPFFFLTNPCVQTAVDVCMHIIILFSSASPFLPKILTETEVKH